MNSSNESGRESAFFVGIDPSNNRNAMTVIVRRIGAPDDVKTYKVDSIARIVDFVTILESLSSRAPDAALSIALEYPVGRWGNHAGMAVVRAAASIIEKELGRVRLKRHVTRVAPSIWHKVLGVSAMKTESDDPKARARVFARAYVLSLRDGEEVSQDEYDSACLAEYARRVLSKMPRKEKSKAVKRKVR